MRKAGDIFMVFRCVPCNGRFARLRKAIRSVLRLYMSPQEIVEDIWSRLSHRKILYWSEVDDESLNILKTTRKKVIEYYGLRDERNRFTVKIFPDLLNNPYAPEALALWIIKCVRDRAKEYSDAS